MHRTVSFYNALLYQCLIRGVIVYFAKLVVYHVKWGCVKTITCSSVLTHKSWGNSYPGCRWVYLSHYGVFHVGQYHSWHLKTTISDTYNFAFDKYRHRYLSEYQYRFNLRFDLVVMFFQLLTAVARKSKRPETWLKHAEDWRFRSFYDLFKHQYLLSSVPGSRHKRQVQLSNVSHCFLRLWRNGEQCWHHCWWKYLLQ